MDYILIPVSQNRSQIVSKTESTLFSDPFITAMSISSSGFVLPLLQSLSFSRQSRRNLGSFLTRFDLSRWEKKAEKDRQKVFRKMKGKEIIIIENTGEEEDGEYEKDENEKVKITRTVPWKSSWLPTPQWRGRRIRVVKQFIDCHDNEFFSESDISSVDFSPTVMSRKRFGTIFNICKPVKLLGALGAGFASWGDQHYAVFWVAPSNFQHLIRCSE
jgi:hypothetical protein